MDWKRWTIDELPLVPFPDGSGAAAMAVHPPDGDRPWMTCVKFPPHHVVASHWHASDAFYIVTAGEMTVGTEGLYRVGDLRWVSAGTFYGPETMGPDGCTFLLIGNGPTDVVFDESTARTIGGISPG
jgi:anti-sigma factor ChrR (cupin superfamily)